MDQAAWNSEWGLNWNRINNNNVNHISTMNRKKKTFKGPPPDDDDSTQQGIEKIQTDIGSLIEELQNKHNSNGKEAVLQEKLAALSRDLEAYRAESQAQ